MAKRKKRQTRKYSPRNEFRYNKSYLAEYHPQFVFGKTPSGNYKSLGLTTHPSKEHKSVPLSKNPNPKDNRNSYLQWRVHTAAPEYYSDKLQDWEFAKEDMPIVRHRIKAYKKSTNRKSKRKPPKKR